MTWLWFTSPYLILLLIISMLSLLSFGVSLLFLAGVSSALFHVVGWRTLSATIWLTDMATFAEMNTVWQSWVVPGETPARATVVSPQLASPEYRIEIAVVAAQP